jgi:hypothetical protein
MDNFNLEDQFKQYLAKVELDPNKMSAIQLHETRNAFMAGAASLLVIFTVEITELSENRAMNEITAIHEQLATFWKSKLPPGQKINAKFPDFYA